MITDFGYSRADLASGSPVGVCWPAIGGRAPSPGHGPLRGCDATFLRCPGSASAKAQTFFFGAFSLLGMASLVRTGTAQKFLDRLLDAQHNLLSTAPQDISIHIPGRPTTREKNPRHPAANPRKMFGGDCTFQGPTTAHNVNLSRHRKVLTFSFPQSNPPRRRQRSSAPPRPRRPSPSSVPSPPPWCSTSVCLPFPLLSPTWARL